MRRESTRTAEFFHPGRANYSHGQVTRCLGAGVEKA